MTKQQLLVTDICPPYIGSESYWTATEITIPDDRNVGKQITYRCTDALMYEGDIDGALEDKTQEGVIECVSGAEGERPKWNKEVVLPCARMLNLFILL